jgi:integrase/recombinase XerD
MAKVYKRGKVWYSIIRINGIRIRKPLSTNKLIAEDRLGDLVKLRNARRHGHTPVDMSWKDFVQKYIQHCEKENQKQNTIDGKRRAFQVFENASPIVKLSQFSPETLDNAKVKWSADHMGVYAINRYLRSLKTAAYKAEFWKLTPKQEWRTVSEFKTPKGRLHFFTRDDLKRLKQQCHGPWLTVYYLGVRAGLRPSELCSLEWRQVDFARNRIHIEPTDRFTPKDFERRYIPMYPDLRKYLQSLEQRDARDLVIVGDNGHALTPGVLSTYMKRLIRKAKLRGSPYTLRHTFASHYVMEGGNIYKLKEYMGHSSIETTMIYVHLARDHGDVAIDHSPPI